MRHPCLPLFAFAVLAASAIAQHRQAPPKRVETGGLSPRQVRTLKAARLHCVVPNYIPDGMRLTKFEFEPATRSEPASYSLNYTGKGKAELIVQMTSDGIGDLILQSDSDDPYESSSWRTVRNPVLGKVKVEFLDLPKEHHFGVNWIDLGEHKSPRFLSVSGRHLGSSEAVKVVKGLRFLK